jgi:regulator of sigma E protease
MQALHTLFYFIVVIGLLVAFHEFGHFWVARRVGVKVLRFSIGFGKVLWRYQPNPDATEYVISAIPLGGYVKMVDEREAAVAEADLPKAFNRQPIWARSAIVVAGPLFNLLLAIILYSAVLMIGEIGMRPIVGVVERGTLAFNAGFHQRDEIISVNQTLTPTWSLAMEQLFSLALDPNTNIAVKVKAVSGQQQTRWLKIPTDLAQHPEQLYQHLGLKPWSPKIPAAIDSVLENSAAEKSGLRRGDLILQADHQPMLDWLQWVAYVKQRPNRAIHIDIKRGSKTLSLTLVPQVVIASNGEKIGKIGAAVHIPPNLIKNLQVEYVLPAPKAFLAACQQTYDYAKISLKMMAKMLIGQASTENLSGPISIAQYAGQSAEMGLVPFLKFLAIISVSLGVLNLLPIPMLDGGHLFLYLIEAIKGSPISTNIQFAFQQIGMVLLMGLMFLTVFLDIGRLFK